MHIQWKSEWTTSALVGVGTFLLGTAAGVAGKHFYEKRQTETVDLDPQLTFEFPDGTTNTLMELVGNLHHEISRLTAYNARELKEKVEGMGYSAPLDEVVVAEEVVPQPYPTAAEIVDSFRNDEEGVNDMSAEEAMEYYASPPVEVAEPEPETETVSIFRNTDDNWNWDAERLQRDDSKPYIIHKDEFFEEDPDRDHKQHQLTWYAGDETLVDEYDTVVTRPEQVVGKLRFGHGTGGDPNVCYVRNVSQDTEYEIILDPSRYDEEILGEEVDKHFVTGDLKHSAVPRFRRD